MVLGAPISSLAAPSTPLNDSKKAEIKELKIIIQDLQKRLSDLEKKTEESGALIEGKNGPLGEEVRKDFPSQNAQIENRNDSSQGGVVSPPGATSEVGDLQQSSTDKDLQDPQNLESSDNVSSTFDSFRSEETWTQGPMPKKPITPLKEASPATDDPYSLGMDSVKKGLGSQARAFFSQVSPKSPQYADALYWLGIIAMVTDNNYDKAMVLLTKAYDVCKERQDKRQLELHVLIKLTECLYHQNKISAARVVLSECKKKANQLKGKLKDKFEDHQILREIEEWNRKIPKKEPA